MKNSDGDNVTFQVDVQFLQGDEYLVSFHDVTRCEESLQFINIMSQMKGVYFVVTNKDEKIEMVSSSLLDELGLDDFQPGKYTRKEFLNDEDLQKVRQHVENDDPSPFEVSIRHEDVVLPVLIQGYFGVINHKRVRVTIAFDLREIKRLQKKAKEQEMLLMQQSKMAQMGEMVGMIAHQWRQPLSAISAASIQAEMKYRLDQLTKEEFSQTQHFIQNECQKMSKVIDTFMNFSRGENSVGYFYFDDVVATVLELVGSKINSNKIVLKREIDPQFEIYGSKSMLEQVVLNLMVNAIDALEHNKIRNKKKIQVKTTPDKKVEIVDNAGGIAKEYKEKLFLPYFTTKEPGKGTGLGLYMSKKIMREHFGGDIYYEKTEDGSKFILDFNKKNGGGVLND